MRTIKIFDNFYRHKFWFWFGLSCAFCLYYGLMSFYHVSIPDYIIQDDARQHVVWLQKFSDAELFPNDLLADYYLGIAPLGYKALYFLVAKIGIQPLVFAKILPIVLGLITTIYLFLFTFEIFPFPFGSFIVTLSFNQIIWPEDNLISATPRAFLYPILAAFLYYLSTKKIIPCVIVMLLQGIFYPQTLLVENSILFLNLFYFNRQNKLSLTNDKKKRILFFASILVTLIIAVLLQIKSPESQDFVSLANMKQMPEFNLYGRNEYFGHNAMFFWFEGRSGINIPFFPREAWIYNTLVIFLPIMVWCSLVLPFLLIKKIGITKLVTKNIFILRHILIGSFSLFFIAHLVFPKLYLPSRYTYHSSRFVIAIAFGIIVTTMIDLSYTWLKKRLENKQQNRLREKSLTGLISLFLAITIIFPFIFPAFINWHRHWEIGTQKPIYQFLAQQPKDILIASITPETESLPAFTQRSILFGRELSIAYHPQYYNQIITRVTDLLNALYTDNYEEMTAVINKYDIDYLLLEDNTFSAEYLEKSSKGWYVYGSWQDTTKQIITELNQGKTPVLTKYIESCKVESSNSLYLLDTSCILENK